MPRYDELVKQLRDNAEFLVKASSGCLSNSFADTMCQAANAIEELSKSRWVPVTEQLPEEYTTILFVSSSGQVHVGYYDSEHKGFCDMTGFRYVCTHWMFAPQPPK